MRLHQCNPEMYVRRPSWREGLFLYKNDHGTWEYNEGGKLGNDAAVATDFYEVHPNKVVIIAYANNPRTQIWTAETGVAATIEDVIANPGIKFTLKPPPLYKVVIEKVTFNELQQLRKLGFCSNMEVT